MIYKYFTPQIHLGPVSDYTFIQELPLKKIEKLIIGDNAEFEISRKVICNSNIKYHHKKNIFFKNNKWHASHEASFEYKHTPEEKNLCFIETQVNLLNGKGLILPYIPGYYVHYIHSYKKNFMSCGNDKYGNPRVIMQMKEFGKWVDGYPAINVKKSKNTTYSLIIINPYEAPCSYEIEINSLNINKIVKLPPLSVKRINFYDIIKKKNWTGQFYIFGKRRAVIYLINHAFNNFNVISTLEHTDPFRAENTYQPRYQFIKHKIHERIKRFFI